MNEPCRGSINTVADLVAALQQFDQTLPLRLVPSDIYGISCRKIGGMYTDTVKDWADDGSYKVVDKEVVVVE